MWGAIGIVDFKTTNAVNGNPANNMRLTTIRRFVMHNPSRWPTLEHAYAKLAETYTLTTESSQPTSPDTLLYDIKCETYTNAVFLQHVADAHRCSLAK